MKATTKKAKAPAPRHAEDVLFELRDMIRCCHLAAWALVNDGDQWGGAPRPPAEGGVIALQFQLERATKLLDEFPL